MRPIPLQTSRPGSPGSSRCESMSRLPSERGALCHGGSHSFRGSVDRSRETAGTATDHQQVAYSRRIRTFGPEIPSASRSAWLLGFRSNGPPATRRSAGPQPARRAPEHRLGLRRLFQVQPSRGQADCVPGPSSSLRVSVSNREPIKVRPVPMCVSTSCRNRKVLRINSLLPSSWAITNRNFGPGMRTCVHRCSRRPTAGHADR